MDNNCCLLSLVILVTSALVILGFPVTSNLMTFQRIETPRVSDSEGSDLSDNFRAPFKASSLVFSDDCHIHVILLVDRVFRRKISAIRAARIVADLSQSLPDNTTVSVGDINSDRWIVIQGGKEEKLFEIVAANKGIRQHLIILSEFAANMDRPFEYLSNLSPAFDKISIAKTSSSLNTNELVKLRQLGKANIIKSADALSLASTMTC